VGGVQKQGTGNREQEKPGGLVVGHELIVRPEDEMICNCGEDRCASLGKPSGTRSPCAENSWINRKWLVQGEKAENFMRKCQYAFYLPGKIYTVRQNLHGKFAMADFHSTLTQAIHLQ
jgi:hypothetical protein